MSHKHYPSLHQMDLIIDDHLFGDLMLSFHGRNSKVFLMPSDVIGKIPTIKFFKLIYNLNGKIISEFSISIRSTCVNKATASVVLMFDRKSDLFVNQTYLSTMLYKETL